MITSRDVRSKDNSRPYLLFAQAVSVVLLLVGALVLMGWRFDIAMLKTVLPGRATMKPNTAICFMLLGVAIWLAVRPESVEAKWQWTRQLCALIATLVGAVTFSEYLWNFNIGIDELLFRKELLATKVPFPGRMAHVTALEFAIFGMALLLLDSNLWMARWWSQRLALLGAIFSLIALVGYVYGADALYSTEEKH